MVQMYSWMMAEQPQIKGPGGQPAPMYAQMMQYLQVTQSCLMHCSLLSSLNGSII